MTFGVTKSVWNYSRVIRGHNRVDTDGIGDRNSKSSFHVLIPGLVTYDKLLEMEMSVGSKIRRRGKMGRDILEWRRIILGSDWNGNLQGNTRGRQDDTCLPFPC